MDGDDCQQKKTGNAEGSKYQCSATNRWDGHRCRRWSAPGFKVCFLHGAGGKNSTRRIQKGNPKTHEEFRMRRYKFKSLALNRALNEFVSDPDRADISEELAILRVLLERRVRRIENLSKLNRGQIRSLVKQITTTAEKMSRIEKNLATGITAEQVKFIADQFLTVIAQEVRDEKTLAKIQDRFDQISVPVKEPVGG